MSTLDIIDFDSAFRNLENGIIPSIFGNSAATNHRRYNIFAPRKNKTISGTKRKAHGNKLLGKCGFNHNK